MDALAKNLKARADELGISQAEAARRSGLSERRYGNYSTGFRNPDLDTLVRIARALQTTPNELLDFNASGRRSTTKAQKLREQVVAAVDMLDDKQLEHLLIQVRALAQVARQPDR